MSTLPPILVVDDERNMRLSLETVLTDEGYKAQAVDSAESGLQLLAREKFLMVISDAHLGGMTGYDFLGQVRKQKVHARSIWVHLPASHGRAVQLVDHPAHRVQRGVVAHERITAWPVDLPVHHAADRG